MPISDPLAFGLSAGSNFNMSSGAGPYQWPGAFNYRGGSAGRLGPRMTPTAAAGAAQKFNLGSATDLENISDRINQINLAATKTAQQARIPNDPALEAQSSTNIGQELQGQVPQDVQNLLAQQAAERGVAGGFGGGPNANAAYLRALGLTSLQQQQAGQQNLSAAVARNPAAPIFDPTTQLLTPYQGAQLELGYQTEADRAAEEQRRLDIEAARGGGGGRGGGGRYGYGGTETGSSPYEYGEPGMYAYGMPTTTTTGGPTVSQSVPFNWQQSLGNYIPAGDTGGTFYAGPNTNQFSDYYDYSGGNQGLI